MKWTPRPGRLGSPRRGPRSSRVDCWMRLPHSGARLHLIAVVPVRREHSLFRRQQWARVHGVAVRPAQPTHIRAAICQRECRSGTCLLVVASRHVRRQTVSISTGDIQLGQVVVRTPRSLELVRKRRREVPARIRGSWSGGSASSSIDSLRSEDRVALQLIFSNVEGGRRQTRSVRPWSSYSLRCRLQVRQRHPATSAVGCTLLRRYTAYI